MGYVIMNTFEVTDEQVSSAFDRAASAQEAQYKARAAASEAVRRLADAETLAGVQNLSLAAERILRDLVIATERAITMHECFVAIRDKREKQKAETGR
jgi:uncharacterized protein with PhoU and TrkA domain